MKSLHPKRLKVFVTPIDEFDALTVPSPPSITTYPLATVNLTRTRPASSKSELSVHLSWSTDNRLADLPFWTGCHRSDSRVQVLTLEENVQKFGLNFFGCADERICVAST